MGFDKIFHHLDAGLVLKDFEFDAFGVDVFFRSFEGDVFADDDSRDFVEQGCAAAHGAGGQSGVQDGATINGGFATACVFEAVHFSVMDDAVFLDALVVSAADDLAFENQNRANGYAAFSQALLCFVNGGGEEWIHGSIQADKNLEVE
jgi:hypothetical protein